MAIRKPSYPLAEIARRGDEIYDRDIRAKVDPLHRDEIVAIDVDARQWQVDPDEDVAAGHLLARLAGAQVWVVRVGSRFLRRFG